MENRIYSTIQVAKMLGATPTYLSHAVWDGRIDPPAKSPGRGVFLWTQGDIERASLFLRRRDASDIFGLDSRGESHQAISFRQELMGAKSL